MYKRYKNHWTLSHQLGKCLSNKKGRLAAAQEALEATAPAKRKRIVEEEEEEVPHKKSRVSFFSALSRF